MDFLEKHNKELMGDFHGFDRIILTGSFRRFFWDGGFKNYLYKEGVWLTEFSKFMDSETEIVHKHIKELALQSNVKIHYVNNSKEDKGKLAKLDLESHPSRTGLISVIKCKEGGTCFRVRGNFESKNLEIRKESGYHSHYYLYYMDAEFGWMYVRIQSWCPFNIQVYMNGREYVKKQLDKESIKYESHENSLTWVENIERAQEISDTLIHKKWARFLNAFAKKVNPHHGKIKILLGEGYFWSIRQCEYATDMLFKKRETLKSLYPKLVQYATLFNGGEDVYSFFGRKLHGNCNKEVTGSTKKFDQGFRVKHTLKKNSIKMYDKNSILRVETTINNSRAYKIYKKCVRKGKETMAWGPMGKAVSNMYRYAQVARESNMRYFNALAIIERPDDLNKKLEKASKPIRVRNKNYKIKQHPALNLLSKETCLILEAINDARFCIQSFSNKDLRNLLLEKGWEDVDTEDPVQLKKFSGKITRLIVKLRAHKLVGKISHTFKYKVTKLGQIIAYNILNFSKMEGAINFA